MLFKGAPGKACFEEEGSEDQERACPGSRISAMRKGSEKRTKVTTHMTTPADRCRAGRCPPWVSPERYKVAEESDRVKPGMGVPCHPVDKEERG